MYEFLYQGYYSTSHSWAVVARNVCKALAEKGHSVGVKSSNGTSGLNGFHRSLANTNLDNPIWIGYTAPPRLKTVTQKTKLLIWNFESSVLPDRFGTFMNKWATCVLPASNAVKNIFIANGVQENKIRVLPYGVDRDIFNPSASPLHIKDDRFTFLVNSIPHHRKGLDILLEAYAAEFRNVDDVRLIVKSQLIPRKANKQAFQISLVEFKAGLQRKYGSALPLIEYDETFYEDSILGGLYTSADAYVSPTRFEGFGMTMLEAMACGIPVITTDYSAMQDYCTDENSYLIETKEIDADKKLQYWKARDGKIGEPSLEHLRHLMRHVYENRDAAKQKAAFAINNTIPRYTWANVVNVITNYLDENYMEEKVATINPPRRTAEERKRDRRRAAISRRNTRKEVRVEAKNSSREAIKRRVREATQKRRDAARDSAMLSRSVSVSETTNDVDVMIRAKSNAVSISSHTILLNEEKNIVGLLNNLYNIFDEIVLVDTGSSDRTVALINNFIDPYNKIKLFKMVRKNSVKFGKGWNQSEQRNFAISKCTSDWIFMIDADERLQNRYRIIIESLILSARANAFAMPRYNYWKGPDTIRIDRFWYPNYSYRLWKRKLDIKYDTKERHCQPMFGKIGYPNVLSHRKISNMAQFHNIPIHHLKYIDIQQEENGMFRANETDVKTAKEVESNANTKRVVSVYKTIDMQDLESATKDPVGLTRSYIDNKTTDGRPSVDIVIPVYNNFHLVERLLRAVDADKSYPIREVILVNDCSSLDCYNKLNSIKGVRILNNPVNIGFTGTANIGMQASESDYVVVLNSDTVPSKGWLSKMVECGESDSDIGIVGPISNAAMNQSVPRRWENNTILSDNFNVDFIGNLIDSLSKTQYPRVLFANGFCYMVKKKVIEAIGYFDEANFAGGYVEEDDYSIRVRQAGFSIAIADNAYVHHDRCSSYGRSKRNKLVKDHIQKAKDKWGKTYSRDVRKFGERDPLLYLRQSVSTWIDDNLLKSRGNRFTINFIAPHFKLAGGVKRIKTIAEQLQERGHDVQIYILDDVREWEKVTVPVSHISDINNDTIRDADFTVCHADGPAQLLLELDSQKGKMVLLHMHFGVHDPKQEIENLELPFDRWATSDWLVETCKTHGLNVTKLGFAIDRAQFYPSDKNIAFNDDLVIGTLYHGVTWKGFADAKTAILNAINHFKDKERRRVRVLMLTRHSISRLHYRELRGNAELVVNPQQDKIRELYSNCDVWLCASWKEGIGMTSVEAMACKTALVTTDTLGSRDFAINDRTALVSKPKDVGALTNNLIMVLEDEKLRSRLAQAGYEKVTSWRWGTIMDEIESYLYANYEGHK